jgi:hypothetical protein
VGLGFPEDARMTETAIPEGTMCIPNISAAGRRRRTQFAVVAAVIGVLGFVAAVAMHASPWLRMLAALPIAAAVATYLQVVRNTCVAHARAGTIEHDDFSTTAAPKEQNEASQKVANGILRDAAIAGAIAAALFWASAYVIA